MNDQDDVAKHYNEHKGLSLEERKSSKILNIRNMNNFIKTILIKKYAKEKDSVLDLGCGKGGDLKKYSKSAISKYVGLDIAENSIHEAKLRYKKMFANFTGEFHCQDVYYQSFDLYQKFDVISCQFSFHYAFKTPESFKITISNIAKHMKPGGYFIATIPNSDTLIRRCKNNGKTFGNEYYTVTFNESYDEMRKRENSFGIEYLFVLDEAVDNCSEYLVSVKAIEIEFNKYNVKMIDYRDFLSYYNKNNMDYEDLRDIMLTRRLNEMEIKVIELYSVIVFQKVAEE